MPALAAIARAARSVLFGCRTDRDQLSPNHHFRLATRGRSIQMGEKRTHAPQQNVSLFDHFVGDRKDSRRNGQAEGLGGFEIDN